MKDFDSRELVVNEVHEIESAVAAKLMQRACWRGGIACRPLVLHSDNCSLMTGATMLSALRNLVVMPSFSRSRVRYDNADAESLFLTAKYCPLWPEKSFDSVAAPT